MAFFLTLCLPMRFMASVDTGAELTAFTTPRCNNRSGGHSGSSSATARADSYPGAPARKPAGACRHLIEPVVRARRRGRGRPAVTPSLPRPSSRGMRRDPRAPRQVCREPTGFGRGRGRPTLEAARQASRREIAGDDHPARDVNKVQSSVTARLRVVRLCSVTAGGRRTSAGNAPAPRPRPDLAGDDGSVGVSSRRPHAGPPRFAPLLDPLR